MFHRERGSMAGAESNAGIMLVSADAANARTVVAHLKSIGYVKVTHMDNGVEAIRSLADNPKDLVVVDVDTRYLAGWMLVKELKTSEKIRNVPVVLFGRPPSPAPKEELQRFGVVEFFSMPGAASALHFLIHSTISVFKTSGTLESKYTKAKSALIEVKTDQAIEMYSELRGQTAKDLRSSVGLVQAYVQGDDVASATSILSEVELSGADQSFASILKLRMFLSQGSAKVAEAQKVLDAILSLTPDSPYYFSRCLKIATEFDALWMIDQICRAAMVFDFQLPEFCLSLAKCRFVNKEYDTAMSLVDVAEKKYGQSTDLLNLKGACLRKLNRVDQAIESYEEALRLSPLDYKIYFNLAICAQNLNKRDLVLEYLQACLRIAPTFTRARQMLDDLEKSKGAS